MTADRQNRTAVPIFNIDKRPFALLCAYNGADHTNRFVSQQTNHPVDSN